MSFATLQFLYFFIVILLGLAIIDHYKKDRIREIFLLFASYFFYGCWDWRFCFLLLFVSIAAYITAIRCQKKLFYLLGLICPLLVLGFFKYFNFFLDTAAFWFGTHPGTLNIILPVGISFYTFQALSYVIDVKRGKIPVENDFIKLALYISFFPQLVAGPIVRASDFFPQLYQKVRLQWNNIGIGIQIMAFGFFKKLVLSDHVAVVVDGVFASPSSWHWTALVFGMIAYTLQLYLDFSGYSDIATGCARCMGYQFRANFNLPYLAQSFTELWSRWHISMSSWFTEYVFYPLGTVSRNRYAQYFAVLFTMFLSGLWHGAGWTYVAWGTLTGLAMVVEKLVHVKPGQTWIGKLGNIIRVMIFHSFFILIFRSQSFSMAGQHLKGLFTFQGGDLWFPIWVPITLFMVIAGSIIAIYLSKKEGLTKVEGFYPIFNLKTIPGAFCFVLFVEIIIAAAYRGEQNFIYFQF